MRFNKINRAFQLIFCLALSQSFSQSISYKILTDLPYYENPVNDTYQKERCMLDLYFPEGIQNFPTIVWFHGGGLKRGSKAIPEQLKEKGLAVVAVNYRLHPKVNAPKYIEDAAAVSSLGVQEYRSIWRRHFTDLSLWFFIWRVFVTDGDLGSKMAQRAQY